MDNKGLEIQKLVADKIAGLKWIKLVGLGNTNVGKTCLIRYFCEGKFTPGYHPTVAVDYGFKIETVNDEDYRVHVWDFSGSDEYEETRCELYEKTDGIFLVYDVTNPSSFDNLKHWIDEISKYTSSKPKPSLVLCACKVDQKQKRIVSRERGEEWAKEYKVKYIEVSPASGWNVAEMFQELLKQVVSQKL